MAKRNSTDHYWTRYRELRNQYNQDIREAKEQYFENLNRYLRNSSHSTKKWWHIANAYLGRNKKSTYPPIRNGMEIITDNTSKADHFNQYFLSHTILDDNHLILPPIIPNHNQMSEIELNEQDITDLLHIIDTSKATGPDMVSPKLLREAGLAIVPSLCKLFRLSLSLQKFPDIWKNANVTPLYKKNDPQTTSNYRPVSLLSCVGKIFERVIFKYTFNFLRDNNILNPNQSGFMPETPQYLN